MVVLDTFQSQLQIHSFPSVLYYLYSTNYFNICFSLWCKMYTKWNECIWSVCPLSIDMKLTVLWRQPSSPNFQVSKVWMHFFPLSNSKMKWFGHGAMPTTPDLGILSQENLLNKSWRTAWANPISRGKKKEEKVGAEGEKLILFWSKWGKSILEFLSNSPGKKDLNFKDMLKYHWSVLRGGIEQWLRFWG